MLQRESLEQSNGSISLPDATNPSAPPTALRQGLGAEQRFAREVAPMIPRLVSAARRILASEDLAWDAVQETLLRLWVSGWLPPHPEGVLQALVRKSCLHILRCQRRRSLHEASFAQASPETCCAEDPLAALEEAERDQSVRHAVNGLREEYRIVLELFDLHGESYESIARTLSLPLGTVRSRLSRGRSLLRQRLLSTHAAGSAG